MATLRTVTVKPSGGDYVSLNAAMVGEAADLVALDRRLDIECYSMSDTVQVVVNGFTTDATRYIRIYTPSSERHRGKWDNTKYRLENTALIVDIQENYVRFEGLQVKLTANTGSGIHGVSTLNVVGTGLIRFSKCIFKGVLSGDVTGVGVSNRSDSGTVVQVHNCLFLDWIRPDISSGYVGGLYTDIGTLQAYNNTFINCHRGIYRVGGVSTIAKNNLFYNCTQPCAGNFEAGTDYNSTNNAAIGYTVTDAGNTHDIVNQVYNFIEPGDDYHLTSYDMGAKDKGIADPSGGAFTDDVDGEVRYGIWDIGFDEYVKPPETGPDVLFFKGGTIAFKETPDGALRIRQENGAIRYFSLDGVSGPVKVKTSTGIKRIM